jgi:DNA repair ATPase RecN
MVETDVGNYKTLFLLAAPKGAGKSTLLKFGFDKLGTILGPKIQDEFLETNLDKARLEYTNFYEARNRESYFHVAHVPFLRAQKPANRSHLIHVDIYNVLRNLAVNSKYLTNQQLNELTSGKISLDKVRQDLELLDKSTNDFVLQTFLDEPFFQKFERIVNITLHCDYNRHQEQLLDRDKEFGFGHPDPSAREIQSEMYDCWSRNISLLKPLANLNITFGPNGYQILT